MTRAGARRAQPFGPLDELLEGAATLAGAWGARARASTTVGQERALLRLYGVTGLDRTGRPLAGAAVDRWLATARDGLGGGIALPFAMALLEYDLEPQQLALDVASGAVDLALEAELLAEPDRRAVAQVEALRLTALALDRIDADRVARRELLGLLGEAERPWIGTTIGEPDLQGAMDEVAAAASAGFDVLRVEVPIGRELAARLQDAGQEPPEWQPRQGRARDGGRGPGVGGPSVSEREDLEAAPSGSQRALAHLRRVADGVAAERRGYVRLATAIPPLGVPEGAIVAAFERVDIVEADPMAEIVVGGIDPDRSLADHAFARRLHLRADTILSIGPGPLVVAPDLASGVPADIPTRSGRALALQLVGLALARADGIGAARLLAGAYPAWLAEEPRAAARILGEVALRRALLPDIALRFDEPLDTGERGGLAAAWPFIAGSALSWTGPAALLLRSATDDHRGAATAIRAAGRVAIAYGDVAGPPAVQGLALEHVRATVQAALSTMERLGELGWRGVLGEPVGAPPAIGGDAVAERTEAFDPLGGVGRVPG
jgi:hypothetical protein